MDGRNHEARIQTPQPFPETTMRFVSVIGALLVCVSHGQLAAIGCDHCWEVAWKSGCDSGCSAATYARHWVAGPATSVIHSNVGCGCAGCSCFSSTTPMNHLTMGPADVMIMGGCGTGNGLHYHPSTPIGFSVSSSSTPMPSAQQMPDAQHGGGSVYGARMPAQGLGPGGTSQPFPGGTQPGLPGGSRISSGRIEVDGNALGTPYGRPSSSWDSTQSSSWSSGSGFGPGGYDNSDTKSNYGQGWGWSENDRQSNAKAGGRDLAEPSAADLEYEYQKDAPIDSIQGRLPRDFRHRGNPMTVDNYPGDMGINPEILAERLKEIIKETIGNEIRIDSTQLNFVRITASSAFDDYTITARIVGDDKMGIEIEVGSDTSRKVDEITQEIVDQLNRSESVSMRMKSRMFVRKAQRPRDWTRVSGGQPVRATMIRGPRSGSVVLRREADGREFVLPLGELSQQDRDYIRRHVDLR